MEVFSGLCNLDMFAVLIDVGVSHPVACNEPRG